MINNENIKELLEKKKLQQILLIALSNSLKLRLTTTSKSHDQIVNIETKINLLKGLTTKISDKSLLFSDNKVLKFHQKQVENAYETWEKNRETIIKLLQIIAGNSVEITSLIKKSSEQSFPLATEENYIEDTNFEDDFTDFALENSVNDKDNQQYPETRDDDDENWIDDIGNENDHDESENFDDISLNLDMMTQEKEIFTSENKEEVVEAEEDWKDFIDEMPEEEEISIKEEVVINSVMENDSPSLEVDDDWQEWLEEDNSSNNNGEHEDQAIDWNEEDWQEEEEIS